MRKEEVVTNLENIFGDRDMRWMLEFEKALGEEVLMAIVDVAVLFQTFPKNCVLFLLGCFILQIILTCDNIK